MPILIGLILIPVVILIIIKSNLVTTKKKNRIILNTLLILISIIYIIGCLVIKAEPFDFEVMYSLEYMFYSGDYILYSGIIFIFSPFMWIILIHFVRMIFRSIRVRKNAIIKRDEEYIYYRGDLDKISPSIIMFISKFDVDMKKSISATILKLKLTGYIKEHNDGFIYTNKDESSLLESEKMVLGLIRYNNFDKNNYKKAIEQETLNNKYIVKNRGKLPFRIIKIIIAVFIPIIVFIFSINLDEYTFDNYKTWPEDDGHTYIILEDRHEIKKLNKEVENENDYYSSTLNINGEERVSYSYDMIRADKLQYGVVRKALFLHILTSFIIGFITIFVLISIYIVIEQIIYINKNYRRTIKGKTLLNKAYALKNYLKEYSLIKDRTEEELVLWEYYLIYAIVLDVNVKIEDKIIERYLRKF